MPATTADSQSSLPSSSSSSTSTPTSNSTRSSSYFTYPVSYAVSGLLRRLTTPSDEDNNPSNNKNNNRKSIGQTAASGITSLSQSIQSILSTDDNMDGVYTPPRRNHSPFQPPPLTPLTLKGWRRSTTQSARLLTKALAEEIRLLVPPRLQLVDDWSLIYSLEQNGVSLATLYEKCDDYRGKRGGFVLVIRDGEGGVFGAYLSDAPHPSPHFFGNGECFLWRAHVLPTLPDLSNLPPPPSADTTNAQRMTTVAAPKNTLSPPSSAHGSRSGTSTPERIRFKAFPYSGVNDYMIFCEHGFLSVGGGDGHYGLWLDDNLENGVSCPCPTFGNEPLSDEGKKFEVLGVELWYLGA
ncbi:TLD-domain-containing protein [Aaosphaeria arxii CBS 175.79]|uniref:Oxidation resistance protein 1 n=1 Tax=Aaosphaeria arxii CBS 175.79 TaxID=1450172 RepID=A0A6A5XYE3_9PLEO|nr:TLD-domain-containing protein [Aaosphaeria arxii CBS 175.79]KAF2018325.1 TLD-domain-containing protein [Aaosphaeria arxii CBS 175.79]